MGKGSSINDVRYLQIILNKDPTTQVNNNPKELGSPGYEAAYFGDLTYAAVARFQDKNHSAAMPDSPLCRDLAQNDWPMYGCGKVGPKTRAALDELVSQMKISENWGLTVDERKQLIKRVIEVKRDSFVPNIEEGLILGAVINEIGGFAFNNEWVRAVTNKAGVLDEADFGRGIMQISSEDYVSTLDSDGVDCKNVNNSNYQCSRYYSNTETGIDRNVTDGLKALMGKYSESNCDLVTPECQGIADGSPFSETETNVKLYGVCGKRGSYNAKVSQLVGHLLC
jgi:peptidoglycan hydrolase-like protein with peptidoglycan-binding domain